MRRFCVVFIFISIFNGAFGQSKISGNRVTNGQLSNYNQSEPFMQENAYSGNLAESAHSKQYFQPGVIITKDGDTLSGLVKYPLDKNNQFT